MLMAEGRRQPAGCAADSRTENVPLCTLCLPTQATTAYLEAECGSAVASPQALHALVNADLAQVTGRDAPGRASSCSCSCAVAFLASSVAADDMQAALA